MQISSRFTIATHMLIIIALKGKESKVTSDFLASSVGVNPVIIRKNLVPTEKGRVDLSRAWNWRGRDYQKS